MGVLARRVALATGASSGIGRATERRFAEEGAAVVACARRASELDELVREIESAGGRAIAIPCDVEVESEIENVVTSAVDRVDRIDILANSAQGAADEFGDIESTGADHVGLVAYSMAKGAIMALTRAASQEWAKYGIATNAFLPWIRTDRFDRTEIAKNLPAMEAASPMRRMGTAYEEGTPLLAFLASEGAGYVNGQAIAVDGGRKLIA